jgi:hypothetical protein
MVPMGAHATFVAKFPRKVLRPLKLAGSDACAGRHAKNDPKLVKNVKSCRTGGTSILETDSAAPMPALAGMPKTTQNLSKM